MAYGFTSLPDSIASPDAILQFVRDHWRIENRSHWRRDVSLGEDRSLIARNKTPQLFAALNNAFLALIDFLRLPNLPTQIRSFQVDPDKNMHLVKLKRLLDKL